MKTKLAPGSKPLSASFGIGQLIAAATALLVAGCILTAFQFVSLRQSLVDDVQVQAALVADNVAAPMMFRDQQTASETLRTFRPPPYLMSIMVYDRQGKQFAAFAASGAAPDEYEVARLLASGSEESLSRIVAIKPVEYRSQDLGHVIVIASTARVWSGLLRYDGLFGTAAVGALFVAALVILKTKARMAKAEARLDYLAYTDPVTELANRRATYDTLAAQIIMQEKEGRQLALLIVDLDNFKAVNDTAGHSAGDALLRMVGEILRSVVRESDVVGRIGGDEFAVVAAPVRDRVEALTIAGRMADAFGRSFDLDGQQVFATASIGISLFPDDSRTLSGLVSSADIALYHAKAAGKNRFAEFRPEMTLETQRRVRIERELRRAMECGELEVHYQPQFDCASKRIVGAEALLRWPHPEDGPISPAEFIPVAEECGLINEIGRWVLVRACSDAAAWCRATATALTVAVNVSARQLVDDGFIGHVQEALRESGLPPEQLELELTESLLMEDVDKALEFMNTVRSLGIRLSIDDFGTGYSSLAYLQSFPINQLKIDRSFIRLLPNAGYTIASAVIALARGFNLSVVAEGVEEPAQLAWLQAAGCDVVQGFLLGRPMPGLAMHALLQLEQVESRIDAAWSETAKSSPLILRESG
ncbi:putative bifunctional diguanylate cyclase/phosphodiesterase [Paraburkholderia aspalathi]|uniref:putative bifunctional diguanylate cyclase/phosphodiesterase n=1 Tax=Paraburkholderia aspalathi TaxID=1324617 RepID=UPI002112BE40|nr:diguanylate cyclase (GGDEF)-like protein [Paraburkholderia sediminicola]